jgi:hypothetical protein
VNEPGLNKFSKKTMKKAPSCLQRQADPCASEPAPSFAAAVANNNCSKNTNKKLDSISQIIAR